MGSFFSAFYAIRCVLFLCKVGKCSSQTAEKRMGAYMSYCDWDQSSELNTRYHDTEWGVPLHDDRGQFEFLMMEVMQCGLNWNMK